jgi:hypothetical protein
MFVAIDLSPEGSGQKPGFRRTNFRKPLGHGLNGTVVLDQGTGS